MASPQAPLISVPTKRTDEIDWVHPIKRYIAQVYQEDPEKYAEETNTINRLRQDMRGAGKDLTGRDLLYRYYGQLELLDLRFPVDEKHIKISFTWYDAFNGKLTSQYSLAFEKASTIFNIASTLSAIAASQNRAEAEGRKRAFNFLQAGAGMYQYINDNFLHAPSADLGRDNVKVLVELTLAQAQECFIENSLREKKKDALIAKLASHATWTYANCVDGITEGLTKSVFDKAWLTVCQVKQKYFQAMSQYHKALACEAEGKYGECVGRLVVAETAAKEAAKLAHSVPTTSANASLPPDAASALQENTKTFSATCSEKLKQATHDNDMIYSDTVPQESVIQPIDRLKAVKSVSISELYGANEINKVIGPDIFAKLIPLSVHESASMYSEEKAKLVRAETERCDLANGELDASLDYMKLPSALEKFRHQNDREDVSLDEFANPTREVRDWADRIRDEETTKSKVAELVDALEALKDRAKDMLDKVALSLDEEMRGCEQMRVKYGDQWNQQPSSSLTTSFRDDLRNHRMSFDQGNSSDRQILQRWEQVARDVSILRQGAASEDLARIFAEALAGIITPEKKDRGSLLDIDIDSGVNKSSTTQKVKRIESALDKLYQVRTERKETMEDLKEKTHQDDISNLLILNKKTTNVEPQLFASELEKYRPHQQRIASTIHQQQQLLKELTAAFKALMEGDDARKVQTQWERAEKQRRNVVERFKRANDGYYEVKDGLTKGIQFYSNLTDVIEVLLRNTQNFASNRGQERQDLARSIDGSKSQMEQQLLKEKLSKYETTPSAPHDASIYQLTDRTRQMDLNQGASAPPQMSAPPISPISVRSPPSLPPQPSLYTAYSAPSAGPPPQAVDHQYTAPPPLPPTQRSNSMTSNPPGNYGYQQTAPSPYTAPVPPQLPPPPPLNQPDPSGYRSYGNLQQQPTSPVYQRPHAPPLSTPGPYQPPPSSTMGPSYRQDSSHQAPPIPGNPPPPLPPQPNYSQGQLDYRSSQPASQPYSPATPVRSGSYSSTPSSNYGAPSQYQPQPQYGYNQQQLPPQQPTGYVPKPQPPIPQSQGYSSSGYQQPPPPQQQQQPYGGYSSYVPPPQPPQMAPQAWNASASSAPTPQWQQQQPPEQQPYPGHYQGPPGQQPPPPQQPYWTGGNSLMD